MTDVVPDLSSPDGCSGSDKEEPPLLTASDLIDEVYREPFRAPWSDALSANA